MTVDKAKLKALAEAATQGRWKSYSGSEFWAVASITRVVAEVRMPYKASDAQEQANAAYIAAASPDTTLALLAEIERGEHLFAATCCALGVVGEALGIPGEEQEGGACELIDAIVQLKAENEALRLAAREPSQSAKRYQWLSRQQWFQWALDEQFGTTETLLEQDEQIDAAMIAADVTDQRDSQHLTHQVGGEG